LNAWPPPLLLHPDHLPWSVDATAAHITPDALAALPWGRAMADLEATEAGAVVNADEGRQVGHYWLRAPERAPSIDIAEAIGATATAVREFAQAVREGRVRTDADESFTDALLVGIGGSELGPHLVVDALGHDAHGAPRGLRLHFLDNTDPDGIAARLGALGPALARTLVLVVSKSGTTPEPANALALTRVALAERGVTAARHLVAITVDGSHLHRTALAEAWLATFPMWEFVGGRYSVTSAVGLLPAELAGVDTVALLDGAAAMDAWTRQTDPLQNPAAVLAGAWHLAGDGRGDRALVILPYADRLVLLSRYLQQLVMESVGKSHDRHGHIVHQGLTVYGNKGSTDQHAYVQQLRDGRDDFLALFVQVLGTDAPDPVLPDGHRAGDHLQGFLLGTRRALAESGRRSVTLTVAQVDPFVVGGLIALFERAVGLYASLIDVNAYHQPGVEAGKVAARALLERGQALVARLAAGPATAVALADALGADPIETLYQLARLHRLGVVGRTSGALHGTWHLR
jgi:glucose-6-phosphate isomerase